MTIWGDLFEEYLTHDEGLRETFERLVETAMV